MSGAVDEKLLLARISFLEKKLEAAQSLNLRLADEHAKAIARALDAEKEADVLARRLQEQDSGRGSG